MRTLGPCHIPKQVFAFQVITLESCVLDSTILPLLRTSEDSPLLQIMFKTLLLDADSISLI